MQLIFAFVLISMPEAKLNSFVLISLAEEISRHQNIDSVVWLLVITVVPFKNER